MHLFALLINSLLPFASILNGGLVRIRILLQQDQEDLRDPFPENKKTTNTSGFRTGM